MFDFRTKSNTIELTNKFRVRFCSITEHNRFNRTIVFDYVRLCSIEIFFGFVRLDTAGDLGPVNYRRQTNHWLHVLLYTSRYFELKPLSWMYSNLLLALSNLPLSRTETHFPWVLSYYNLLMTILKNLEVHLSQLTMSCFPAEVLEILHNCSIVCCSNYRVCGCKNPKARPIFTSHNFVCVK